VAAVPNATADLVTAEPVTDCHVHLLPGRLGEAVRAFFAAHIDGALSYPNDHGAVLDALAAGGVRQAWHLPYAHKPGVAAGLNTASRELMATWRGHGVEVVGGLTVHPGDDDPARLVDEAVDDLGLRVLKVHCSVGGFDVDDPRLDPAWRRVEAHRVPVVVHAGHDVTGLTSAAELAPLDRVARRFPDVPLVVAHAAHPATDAAVALVEAHPNVYVDLTPRVVDVVALDPGTIEAIAERVLFGSDLPNTQVTLEDNLARLGRLSPPTRRAVASGNAARLQAAVR
jgi:predicted TIM-barrel fold metal-dependent hydrolase